MSGERTREQRESAGASDRRPRCLLAVASGAPTAARRLAGLLEKQGYETEVTRDLHALDHADATVYELVVFDLTPPATAAKAALARLHPRGSPVLVYSGTADLRDVVDGLDLGAADFITAAVTPEELAARIRVVRRRTQLAPHASSPRLLTAGPVVMDVATRRVEVSGRRVMLTGLEFRLLRYFVEHPDQPLDRDRLLDEVWGYSVGGTATVTVHVRRLREKIEDDPARPTLIRTMWGVGYAFVTSRGQSGGIPTDDAPG